MTNAMIILLESVKLMEDGKIGTTGRAFEIENADGTKKTLMEPEQIHTFARWKALGFSVKKGEKAVAKFPIWKCAIKKSEDELTEEDKRLFMKLSAFFSAAQVEKSAAGA